jgi:hypothetical protein
MRFVDEKVLPVTYFDRKWVAHGGLLYMCNDSPEHLVMVLSHQPFFGLQLQVSATGCQMHPNSAYNLVINTKSHAKMYREVIRSWKWDPPTETIRMGRAKSFERLRETMSQYK